MTSLLKIPNPKILGIFRQANVTLTRWVVRNSIFVLIRMARAVRLDSGKRKSVRTSLSGSQLTYFLTIAWLAPSRFILNTCKQFVLLCRKLQRVCSGSSVHARCIVLLSGQHPTNVSLAEMPWDLNLIAVPFYHWSYPGPLSQVEITINFYSPACGNVVTDSAVVALSKTNVGNWLYTIYNTREYTVASHPVLLYHSVTI